MNFYGDLCAAVGAVGQVLAPERIQAGDTEVTDEVMDLFRKFM